MKHLILGLEVMQCSRRRILIITQVGCYIDGKGLQFRQCGFQCIPANILQEKVFFRNTLYICSHLNKIAMSRTRVSPVLYLWHKMEIRQMLSQHEVLRCSQSPTLSLHQHSSTPSLSVQAYIYVSCTAFPPFDAASNSRICTGHWLHFIEMKICI